MQRDVLQVKKIEVGDHLVQKIGNKLATSARSSALHKALQMQKRELEAVKAGDNWVFLFICRHCLFWKRGMGAGIFLNTATVDQVQMQLQRLLCKVPIENIRITNEVAVLFERLPGRAIHDPKVGTSFIRENNRLTLV